MLSPVIEPGIDAVVVDLDLEDPSPLKREQAFLLQRDKTLPCLTGLVAVYCGVEASKWGRSTLAYHFDAKVTWKWMDVKKDSAGTQRFVYLSQDVHDALKR